jgi:hypothetical protein
LGAARVKFTAPTPTVEVATVVVEAVAVAEAAVATTAAAAATPLVGVVTAVVTAAVVAAGVGVPATEVAPRRERVLTSRRDAAWLPCREGSCPRHFFLLPLTFLTSLRCAIIRVGGRRQIFFQTALSVGLVSK